MAIRPAAFGFMEATTALLIRRVMLEQCTQSQLEAEFGAGNSDVIFVARNIPESIIKNKEYIANVENIKSIYQYIYLIRTLDPKIYKWLNYYVTWDECIIVYENVENKKTICSKSISLIQDEVVLRKAVNIFLRQRSKMELIEEVKKMFQGAANIDKVLSTPIEEFKNQWYGQKGNYSRNLLREETLETKIDLPELTSIPHAIPLESMPDLNEEYNILPDIDERFNGSDFINVGPSMMPTVQEICDFEMDFEMDSIFQERIDESCCWL